MHLFQHGGVHASRGEIEMGQLIENVKAKSMQSDRHSQIIKAKTLPLFF